MQHLTCRVSVGHNDDESSAIGIGSPKTLPPSSLHFLDLIVNKSVPKIIINNTIFFSN